ncbi:OB-fold domain-containing protein [Nocardioides panacisoli]|uniref:Zn-ribbon domain-containing OB-fold protein n=1 Tax=Nocardioides panacisoli TaxID=627624 RepID=UPI001C626523|nr:OB-fold domain-containing protein [Nocardioides panacisoli]QYJ04124.1 OB-fold domain-containing protein [Nocardioides panacisoli]
MTSTPSTPAVEGWFTTGEQPRLLASRCTTCADVVFPPVPAAAATFCRNPTCAGEEAETVELSARGRVWSYTDAQYQPPAPYVPESETYEPFAIAAVELPEGLTVLGQVARGYGVADLTVGDAVELVVETLHADESGDRTIWRWRPILAGRAAREERTGVARPDEEVEAE